MKTNATDGLREPLASWDEFIFYDTIAILQPAPHVRRHKLRPVRTVRESGKLDKSPLPIYLNGRTTITTDV